MNVDLTNIDTDNSVRVCAVVLAEEARQQIEAAYLQRHISHHIIREQILFREVPGWIKAYGKPTADRAVRYILSMPLDLILSKQGKEANERWFKRERLAALKSRPSGNNWINRAFIKLCGMPLYGLALGLVALWAPSHAEARDRGRHEHLQACAAAREADRHAMGCWRFSPSEIAISRPWDDPPARPSWDNKRPWESDIDR